MDTQYSRFVWTMGLIGVSAVALGGEPAPAPKPAHPQEPVGFVTGAVVGAFAAGPVGAVVGAGLGTWLGNRVHRAGDAAKAEAQVARLESDKAQLQAQTVTLVTEKAQLSVSNATLSAKLEDLSRKIEVAQSGTEDASGVLDGLQGDVLFRTGSAAITPEIAHQVEVLATAVAKSPSLKVRVDGYADPRGSDAVNMKLSQDRANAVRDLLLASGVDESVLEVNAYGKSQSVAADSDGYALERRVRLTLRLDDAAVAQVGRNE